MKFADQYDVFAATDYQKEPAVETTRFTRLQLDGSCLELEDRPFLMVSSTSWTEDEDFSILFESLEAIDSLEEDPEIPAIVCIITGKGPQQGYYRDLIRRKTWNRVQFEMVWLEADEYPKMIAASDVGVCLHNSSSGLDLPMKILDMFGCCLPVIAFDYEW